MVKRSVLQYYHIFIILLFHKPNVLHRYTIDRLAGFFFSPPFLLHITEDISLSNKTPVPQNWFQLSSDTKDYRVKQDAVSEDKLIYLHVSQNSFATLGDRKRRYFNGRCT